MKRLLAMLLTVVMVLSMAACAGGGDSGGSDDASDSGDKKAASGEAITFLINEPESTPYAAPYTEMVERWNEKNPDTPVELQYGVGDTTEYYQKLTAAIAAGDAPDIVAAHDQGINKLVKSGYPFDLTDYVKTENYGEGAIKAATYDGKIIAMPTFCDIRVLYCNTALFKEAGLDLPETWDDVIEAGKKLATDDRYGLYIDVSDKGHELYTDIPFLWVSGGNVVDSDGKVVYKSDETKRFLEFMRKLAKEGVINQSSEYRADDPSVFGSGLAAMQVMEENRVKILQDDYPEIEFDVVPIPVPEKGMQSTSIIGSWKLLVNKEGKDPEKAAEFLQFLAYENYDVFVKALMEVPISSFNMEVYKQVDEEMDPRSQFIYDEVLPNGTSAPSFGDDYGDLFATSVEDAIFTDKSIDDIMTETQEKMEALVEE